MIGQPVPDVCLKTRVRDESVSGPNPFRWEDVQTGTLLGKGRQTWSWDGRDRKGNYVKSGKYHMVITARTSAGTVRVTRPIQVGAFRIVTSDGTPKRGQRLRIRVYSTEPLKSAPRIRISQPGARDRTVTTRRAGSAYVATVGLRSDGKRGDLRVRAIGIDKGGERQDTLRTLRIH